MLHNSLWSPVRSRAGSPAGSTRRDQGGFGVRARARVGRLNYGRRPDDPGHKARQRAQELAARQVELSQQRGSSEADARRAQHRAKYPRSMQHGAPCRSRSPSRSQLDHERAAFVHEQAAAEGVGDREEHETRRPATPSGNRRRPCFGRTSRGRSNPVRGRRPGPAFTSSRTAEPASSPISGSL